VSIFTTAVSKIFGTAPRSLASGAAVVVDARGHSTLSIVAGAGATVTVSRVDSVSASAHTTGPNTFDVTAGTHSATDVDWPYYRISASGGSARYALL
jgi:hypothetical protein